MTTLWWIRDDLRLADNPALSAAVADGPVVAVHLDERIPGARALGGAAQWWLHHSLLALAADLREAGVPLILASGDPRDLIPRVAGAVAAEAVVWNRRYHQPARDVDAQVKAELSDSAGVRVESFAANLLHEPWTLQTKAGGPFRVYSAFVRAWVEQQAPRHPSPPPQDLRGPADLTAIAEGYALAQWLESEVWERRLGERGWLPTRPDWAGGLRERWTPGEAGAQQRLRELADVLDGYAADRDRPDRHGTSYLSPHLRFGEVSPFQVWHRSWDISAGSGAAGADAFRGELLWREFAWHRRYHLPCLATDNIRPEFDNFPWDGSRQTLHAWQQGRTGVPLVDAGMRELWETGYMHNRVRMVTASFLVKNLRHHWRAGEEWFWDTLVDADEASNPFNWQWVAGTGDDAAPYFRIFNPQRQREKFDPDGHYVRRWLGDLGEVYELQTPPIVDLRTSRAEALAAYHTDVKGRS